MDQDYSNFLQSNNLQLDKLYKYKDQADKLHFGIHMDSSNIHRGLYQHKIHISTFAQLHNGHNHNLLPQKSYIFQEYRFILEGIHYLMCILAQLYSRTHHLYIQSPQDNLQDHKEHNNFRWHIFKEVHKLQNHKDELFEYIYCLNSNSLKDTEHHDSNSLDQWYKLHCHIFNH